ncbi:MAG: S41 family peptidase [Bacteroidota bacterium]
MKSYLSFLCLIICLNSFSQKKVFDVQKKYSVRQIHEDIDYTEKYLIKFHPDPFKYISRDSLHAFVLYSKAKIDTPLTEMQARFYIKRIVAKIGCGHSDVGPSKKYTKAVIKLNRPALPLNTFVVDTNKLFVLNNLSKDTTIKPGDEILSIDKRHVNTILKTIYSISTSDGYNTTYKKQGTKYQWFKYYYSFCYGFKPSYIVTLKHKDQSISSYTLEAISSLKDTLIAPKKDTVICVAKTKTCNYSVLKDDKSIGVIDVNSFKGKNWHKFFKKSFKDIHENKIEHLVIDLRDNGGGQINDGLNMLSYIIDKKLLLPFERKPNLIIFNPKYKMGINRATPLAFCAFMPKTFRNGRLRYYFISFPKKKYTYRGQVYVLINGKSFSMSAVAASYLKYKAKAVVLGEETGGNIAGSNAVISGKILLPNTRIQVFIPMYHLYHDVDVINEGRGIIPDYKTHYTEADILNGVDIDMIKVFELVK